jgi:hypothetical protein
MGQTEFNVHRPTSLGARRGRDGCDAATSHSASLYTLSIRRNFPFPPAPATPALLISASPMASGAGFPRTATAKIFPRRGLALFTPVISVRQNAVQLMTARAVRVTNLTPGSDNLPPVELPDIGREHRPREHEVCAAGEVLGHRGVAHVA